MDKPISRQNVSELGETLEMAGYKVQQFESEGWILKGMDKTIPLDAKTHRQALLEATAKVLPSKNGGVRLGAGKKKTAPREYAAIRPRIDVNHLSDLERRAKFLGTTVEEVINQLLDKYLGYRLLGLELETDVVELLRVAAGRYSEGEHCVVNRVLRKYLPTDHPKYDRDGMIIGGMGG